MKQVEEKKKKIFTFTNIIIILATIVYILNIFVISPDTGSASIDLIDMIKKGGQELTQTHIIAAKIIGRWGGHVNDFLGFNINNIFSGEIWRIYTVVLTHAHIAHFIMNMLALYIAGNNIEKKYGTSKTIILFLILTAINGFVTDLICFKLLGTEYATSYGASGWITSLMGIILAKCLIDKNYYKNEFSKFSRIYLIIYFISTTFILMPNIFTITAHVSGLLCGALTEYIIYKHTKKRTIS